MTRVDDHKRGRDIWFYRIGIGSTDRVNADTGWKFRTLSTLVQQLNDTGVRLLFCRMTAVILVFSFLQSVALRTTGDDTIRYDDFNPLSPTVAIWVQL